MRAFCLPLTTATVTGCGLGMLGRRRRMRYGSRALTEAMARESPKRKEEVRILLPARSVACSSLVNDALFESAALRPTRTPPRRQPETCRSQLCPHKNTSRAWRVPRFNVRKGLDAKYRDDRCVLHFFLRAFGPTIRDPGVSGIAAKFNDR